MAEKNCVVTFLICIFLLVNLAFAAEKSDSFSDVESATTQAKELDWFYLPWYHSWFQSHPWPFVHPPMPAGGFRSHPWSFVHPPMSAGGFHPRFPYPWAHRYPVPSPRKDNTGKN
ncbi:hypothetical protein T459_17316 [Capsicum annuum]|uniref:Transmembrane protein n=1 Tax=Capsicum annuum TaxID=4072 RepID=A0A2G2ZBD6_CAPAN|nr:hypothetical protein FXO37_36087 [Capsicum annuum]PHT79264.1 hypothetical protein T459_17316 [Capsicum annuum]